MSLITDLLAKVKKQEPRRDIPPILKDEVLQSKSERRARRRLLGVLVLAVILVVAGVGVLYVVESMKGPSLLVSTPATSALPVQSPPQAIAPASPSQAGAGAAATPPSDLKVKEFASQPEKGNASSLTPHKRKAQKKYARRSEPQAAGSVREMKGEKAVAGNYTGQENISGSMTRQERDMNLYLARTYEAQKNYQQALMHYRKVLAMEPNNYVVMNSIASMLIYLGSCEEAVGQVQNALRIRSGYIFSLINLGVGYGCLGKQSESESYFRKALAREPSNAHALLNLGLLYEKQNAFENADRCYRKLTEGENIEGYLGLARIAEKQKKTDDAIRFYRMAATMGSIDTPTAAMVNERLIQLTR